MADLRIIDAPEIPKNNITGQEKLPTGGSGNYSITLDSLADYTKTKKDLADNTSVDNKVNSVRQELDAHIEDLLNPHQVTKGQIGLGNVDNTADLDKPVSNSTQAAIISAVAPKADKTYVDNQLTLKANKADVYTKQESSDLVNNSISTALTPVNTSLDLAKRGVANRYDPSLVYNSGERVVLANGDIVKSTIDGNTNDPNANMTGWVKTNSASQVFDESGVTQQEINTYQINLNTKVKSSVIYAAEYNLSESEDNTSIYNQIISDAAEGAKIVFPYGKTLHGHFISNNKALNLDLNGSTLVNTVNYKPLIQIGPLSATEYAVTETVLNHLDTKFTVVGASVLFKAGDIGYLWDGAIRPTSGDVNHEAIKIKEITGDVITVEGFLASYKGAGQIKFYHSTVQLKNASFFNGKLSPTNTHTALVGAIFNVENPDVHKIETFGTTGVAVALRYCYGANVQDIKPNKAAAIGSGEGYGLQLLAVSNFVVKNINGSGMRHVYDQDSAYFGDIKNLSDDDDKSACVVLAHTGFTGYITLDGVRAVTSQYPVVLSEQGYGGTVPAEKGKHPFRFIKVRNVNATIREDVTVNTNGVFGVYFQNSIIGCNIDGVDITFKNPEQLTATGQSIAVRVNGIIDKTCNINNITASSIARFLFTNSQGRGSLTYNYGQAILRNFSAKDCRHVYHMQGFANVNLDDVNITNNILSNEIGLMELIGSDTPIAAWHGEKIYHRNTGVAQLNCNTSLPIQGKLSLGYKTASISTSVSAGDSITNNVLQEKSAFLQLDSGVGTATITLNATTALPKPATLGDELFITVLPSRNAVSFPAGNNIRIAFTVAQNEVVKLRVLSGKWAVVSRNSAI